MRRLLYLLLLICFAKATHAQDEQKAFNFSGYIEVYYLYNFNRPINNTQPTFLYSYNRVNEVNLNLGYAKVNYTSDKIRGNLALMAGTYTQANLAAEPDVLKQVFEANVGVKLSTKKNFWIDAGIFSSHIGFESAIGKDSYNLTRSILAENSPYYEAGIKFGYTSNNDKWFISALVLNGWQRIKRQDGNTTPAFGTQITYKPSASVILNSSSFIGNDKPDSIKQMRYFHNFYAIFQVSEKWAMITGFDAGIQQKAKGSSQMNFWYSPVLVTKYTATDKLTISARTEYYNDKNGVLIATATPHGFQTFGQSVNLDYAIQKNVLWRIEARTLKSKDKIFEKRNGTFTSNSTWFATSVTVSF